MSALLEYLVIVVASIVLMVVAGVKCCPSRPQEKAGSGRGVPSSGSGKVGLKTRDTPGAPSPRPPQLPPQHLQVEDPIPVPVSTIIGPPSEPAGPPPMYPANFMSAGMMSAGAALGAGLMSQIASGEAQNLYGAAVRVASKARNTGAPESYQDVANMLSEGARSLSVPLAERRRGSRQSSRAPDPSQLAGWVSSAADAAAMLPGALQQVSSMAPSLPPTSSLANPELLAAWMQDTTDRTAGAIRSAGAAATDAGLAPVHSETFASMLQSLGNTGASAVRAASVTRDSYPEVTGVMDQAAQFLNVPTSGARRRSHSRNDEVVEHMLPQPRNRRGMSPPRQRAGAGRQ